VTRPIRPPTARELFFPSESCTGVDSEAREAAFFHAIRLKNGSNKTTYAHRLDSVTEVVNRLLPAHRPLEIMDVAVSSGVGTLEWMEALDRAGVEYRMTAGDLCINAWLLSFTRMLNILVDTSGYPLQFDICGRAVPYPIGRRRTLLFPPLLVFAAMCRLALPALLSSRSRARISRGVRLVTPRLLTHAALTLVEDDLLAPGAFERRFHTVRAANVLNRAYFDEQTLRRMAANLIARLTVGGVLVVCRTAPDGVNHGTVFRLIDAHQLDLCARIGDGCDVEALILESGPRVVQQV
jgi:hypothetical protein